MKRKGGGGRGSGLKRGVGAEEKIEGQAAADADAKSGEDRDKAGPVAAGEGFGKQALGAGEGGCELAVKRGVDACETLGVARGGFGEEVVRRVALVAVTGGTIFSAASLRGGSEPPAGIFGKR